jgi:hypothetical protein
MLYVQSFHQVKILSDHACCPRRLIELIVQENWWRNMVYTCPCAFREYSNSWGRWENNAVELEKKQQWNICKGWLGSNLEIEYTRSPWQVVSEGYSSDRGFSSHNLSKPLDWSSFISSSQVLLADKDASMELFLTYISTSLGCRESWRAINCKDPEAEVN